MMPSSKKLKTTNPVDTTPSSTQDVKNFTEVADSLTRGGAWDETDLDAIDQFADEWQGDEGSVDASVDKDKIHVPKTNKEVEREILTEAQITQEVITVLTKRVESSLLRASGSSDTSILQMVNRQLESHNQTIEKWMKGMESRLLAAEKNSGAESQTQFSRIDERLAQMEIRIETLTGSITTHGAEEARLIHEAYKVIMDRKATEEDNPSEPSIYNRFDSRIKALNDQLVDLEPVAVRGIERAVTDQRTEQARLQAARKKFGRR